MLFPNGFSLVIGEKEILHTYGGNGTELSLPFCATGKCQVSTHVKETLLELRKHFSRPNNNSDWILRAFCRRRPCVCGVCWFTAPPADMMDVLCDSAVSPLYFSSFFFFIFPRGHLIFQKLSTDVAVMALRPPSPLGQLDWSWNKCNRRKLVSVKFPAAASFDSPARQNTALGVVRLCDEWAFNRDDFCLLPRVLSLFFVFFICILFIHFLPTGCATFSMPAAPADICPRRPTDSLWIHFSYCRIVSSSGVAETGLVLKHSTDFKYSNLEVPGIVRCVTAHSFCHVAAFCLPDVWRASIGGVASRRLFANANF